MASDPADPLLEPCRPYRPGDHARWLRGRLNRSMLIAAVVGGILSSVIGLGATYAARGMQGLPAVIAEWSIVVLFPVAFFAIHWATIGRHRWAAIELVMWAGRIDTARYLAATGIRDPTDRDRAAAWLAAHPPVDGEDPEATYWRAYIHLLLGEHAAGRAELSRLPEGAVRDHERATLAAQLDLAEGLPVAIRPLEVAIEALEPGETRAVAAVEVGALRSQVAWTCGEDDVAPVLAALPLVDGRARRTLLRHYWLPLAATAVVAWIAVTLFVSLLG